MISHLSIPSKDPLRTGRVLARILDAELLNFPSVKGAVAAYTRDGSGLAIEVWPDDAVQNPGSGVFDAAAAQDVPVWDKSRRPWDYQISYGSPAPNRFAMHIALDTKLSAQEVIALGEGEGWRCFETDRVYFKVVEMWVDNRFLFEIFPEGVELDRFRKVSTDLDTMRELWGVVPD